MEERGMEEREEGWSRAERGGFERRRGGGGEEEERGERRVFIFLLSFDFYFS